MRNSSYLHVMIKAVKSSTIWKGCVRMSVESLKVQLIKKAWGDEAFKAKLVSDPKSAIKEAFGIEVPAGIEVKVVEETPSLYYLTIPPKPEDVADGGSSVQFVW